MTIIVRVMWDFSLFLLIHKEDDRVEGPECGIGDFFSLFVEKILMGEIGVAEWVWE